MSFEDRLYPLLAAYIGSPQWVKSSIGFLYAALPTTLRRGADYRRYLDEAELNERTALNSLCNDKLRSALRWAIETVPYYAPYRALLGELAQPQAVLAQLPLVSKGDFKAGLDQFVSKAVPASRRLTTFTGGSTANPMKFYLHKGVSRFKEYAFIETFQRRVGLEPQATVLAMRGRTVPTAARPGGRIWMYEPIKRQLIVSCDHLEPRHLPEYVEAMRRWRPRFIEAYPSALMPLARWLSDGRNADVVGPIEGILLYSENVYTYQMELFRRVFKCPILSHYGHSERVAMAATMPDDTRHFFWPQYGHIELLDKTGNAVTTPGKLGEIVGTAFDNAAMSFIRYRTGDLAVYSEGEHPLLPGYLAVERIEGRLQEFVVCADQRLISVCTLGAAHFGELADVDVMQYEQQVPGHVILKVVTNTRLSAATRDGICRAIVNKTQGGCSAEVREVPEIARTARGKHQMLIQHLDLSTYFGASFAP